MKQNPHTFGQAPDSVTLEPAAPAPGKRQIFKQDHPLIVEAKIRNGHLVLPASWRDDYEEYVWIKNASLD